LIIVLGTAVALNKSVIFSTIMSKYKLLLIGLIVDGVGILTSSWVLPIVGDFADILWAPFTAWLMTKMYKGNKGKIAAAVVFIEEAMPFMDVIPTFTLMWLYTYVFTNSKKGKEVKIKKTIDV